MFPVFFLTVKLTDNPRKENELIERIAGKDEKALSELYDRYAKLLYSVILAIVKDQKEAEELLQEVFITVWNKSSLFSLKKGNAYSWLVAITRNIAIDRIRSKKFKDHRSLMEGIELPLENIDTSPLDAMIIVERSLIVNEALSKIPHEQKETIMLTYFEGYSQKEIAELLDIPLGTVKTRIRMGMQKLQTLILSGIEQ